MPDSRRHRGPHPEDRKLFAPGFHPALQSAVTDLSLLLTRGYPQRSALKLVGDRHLLTARQRQAVARSSCSDAARGHRERCRVAPEAVAGNPLLIDGFNLLTTLETALSGGAVLPGSDGCFRDIASMHGNYRVLEETRPALELAVHAISRLGPSEVRWYLDQPVSNSGRLKALLAGIIEASGDCPPTDIQVVPDPDLVLSGSPDIIATSDGGILDRCSRWLNLARLVVEQEIPDAWIIPMLPPDNDEIP